MSATSKNGTAYELTGPADAPVVVLIHGLGLTRRTWYRIGPVLAQNYRVLSYDLCGHGHSALPEKSPGLAVLSDQLRGLLDELSINKCAIVGFSLGGMINRRFAMDNPGRASALVILNSPHERSVEQQQLVEERATQTGEGGPAVNIDATLERWFTAEFREDRPDAIGLVRDWVLANDPDNYTGHRKVLAYGVIELIRPEPQITLPTLVIACENDSGSTPEMARAIASEIPGSETIIVPGLQHLGLIEEPALFSEPIIDFLGRTIGNNNIQVRTTT